MHLTGNPTVTWNGAPSPVSIRSIPTDDGHTLTFDVPGGTTVIEGHHMILFGDNAPNALAVNTFFGCHGGEITFPSHINVKNACDWTGVDCGAVTGAGSACDNSPPSILCPTCTGDYDGCGQGYRLPVGVNGALVCVADDVVAPRSPAATSLTVSIATATFYFTAGSPITVNISQTPFDLFAKLSNGVNAIPNLNAPNPPVYGAKVTAIRLTMANNSNATIPTNQVVVAKSGDEDSGRDIDLQYPAGGTALTPGQPVKVIGQASSSPDGWQATHACDKGQKTFLRRIAVVKP